ncbi:BQ5605_C002g01698 [Microbotryum silenes-dioicae]|uniref:BQ5605_C002g01698 protein n=1 Tax=Microbotryum silenes-dioicae TaxID=796604 RepID=A0A2X0P290_9BASI|nr:BQ5605_C002g01698 [Microbotryum silenes-dioicae]
MAIDGNELEDARERERVRLELASRHAIVTNGPDRSTINAAYRSQQPPHLLRWAAHGPSLCARGDARLTLAIRVGGRTALHTSLHFPRVHPSPLQSSLHDTSKLQMPPSNAGKAEEDLSTRLLHADHHLVARPEVAPAISVSTTFRAPSPAEILAAAPGHYTTDWDPSIPSRDIYSRYTQPVLTQAEAVLSAIIGQPTIAYPSGIAATFAILLYILPDVIAITDGYHGCHASIEVYRKTRGEDRVSVIKLDDAYPKDKKLLVWLETPLNPTGECRSIEACQSKVIFRGDAQKAHAARGTMVVDSTFAPPPLQDPFKWGADIVMHSGTKYFGGHSDLLCGTVSVKDKQSWLNVSR